MAATKRTAQAKAKAPAKAKAKDESKPKRTFKRLSDEEKKARDEKLATERQERIDAGEIVPIRGGGEFIKFSGEDTRARIRGDIGKVVDVYRKDGRDKPLVFVDVATKVGMKYPEEAQGALFALEHLGFVERFYHKGGNGARGRGRVAYRWVGD